MFYFSTTVALDCKNTNNITSSLNPAGESGSISYNDRSLCNTPVRITDVTGRLLQQELVNAMPYTLNCSRFLVYTFHGRNNTRIHQKINRAFVPAALPRSPVTYWRITGGENIY